MIPPFNASGVLPPFTGVTAADPAGASPFKTTIVEAARRYCTSSERKEILAGLLSYRSRLRELGVVNGFQWLDGSFIEHVESTRSRPPADIDIVTFAARPVADQEDWRALFSANPEIFNPIRAKEVFKVDAYFVDLSIRPDLIVATTAYWFGLFSHQRDTALWKGMLQVPISCDDTAADEIVAAFGLPEQGEVTAEADDHA